MEVHATGLPSGIISKEETWVIFAVFVAILPMLLLFVIFILFRAHYRKTQNEQQTKTLKNIYIALNIAIVLNGIGAAFWY
jgi:heme/copper-type cytochrome/quinol oxidase subunit 2